MNSKLHVCVFSVLGCIVSILFVPQPTFAEDPPGDDLRALGRTAFYEGRYADAERYFRQRVARVEARSDGSPSDIAVCRGALACRLEVKGDYAEAEPLFDSARSVLRADSAEDCQQSAIIFSHLGTV